MVFWFESGGLGIRLQSPGRTARWAIEHGEGGAMASEENRQELEAKVTVLVATRFGGDYRAAFGHYDADGDGAISKDELTTLLADAGVGSGWTRWAWASGVMAELDTNGDGVIAWAEFEAVFEGKPGPNAPA
jgi:hypothetical protein